ncbi:phosphoribosylamine--glycine ligase [Consotaella salsifontis]|uniref:Phosphoribosylamine--glycine ligase n=1 Tax=Consotaella salsifontis TaxID=1365950 RepID=A0A1T4MZK2_9HYPH|nr:phosphoribosylamine--glycine ligase [Consotaella salsifontis]SJZ72274.1 phosphoribosylamine--glycine ligase [Consotaella salsifontis]
MTTNVLLIGSGGREAALAWKIARSPELGAFYAAPGNPGIADHAEIVELDAADHQAVVAFCRDREIGLVVVGPEAPLVAGLADALAGAGIPVFGPSAAAARLEGSKGFTKDFCARWTIPTARYRRFDALAEAEAHVRREGAPIVIKADGLAAGKGVTVAMTVEEAILALRTCFAGTDEAEVVIEEYLEGEEASLFCLCDGERALPFGTAQDHKRAFDGDRGPNTGGMGAISPAFGLTQDLFLRAMDEIIEPTVRGMKEEGAPFAGVLYAGLILTEQGPKLIEYNVRFGDPECQVLMMRLESDLLPILLAAANGDLSAVSPVWSHDAAVTVVMAAEGYPGEYRKGTIIGALPPEDEKSVIFQAGTARDGDRLLANGGRVLCVTARGANAREATRLAYETVERVDWPESFYRSDIGHHAIMREPM